MPMGQNPSWFGNQGARVQAHMMAAQAHADNASDASAKLFTAKCFLLQIGLRCLMTSCKFVASWAEKSLEALGALALEQFWVVVAFAWQRSSQIVSWEMTTPSWLLT